MARFSVTRWIEGLNTRINKLRLGEAEAVVADDVDLSGLELRPEKGLNTGSTAAGDYRFRGTWVTKSDGKKFIEAGDSLIISLSSALATFVRRWYNTSGQLQSTLVQEQSIGVPIKPGTAPQVSLNTSGSTSSGTVKAQSNIYTESFGAAIHNATTDEGRYADIAEQATKRDGTVFYSSGTTLASFNPSTGYVKRINITTGAVTVSDVQLTHKSKYFIHNGKLVGIDADYENIQAMDIISSSAAYTSTIADPTVPTFDASDYEAGFSAQTLRSKSHTLAEDKLIITKNYQYTSWKDIQNSVRGDKNTASTTPTNYSSATDFTDAGTFGHIKGSNDSAGRVLLLIYPTAAVNENSNIGIRVGTSFDNDDLSTGNTDTNYGNGHQTRSSPYASPPGNPSNYSYPYTSQWYGKYKDITINSVGYRAALIWRVDWYAESMVYQHGINVHYEGYNNQTPHYAGPQILFTPFHTWGWSGFETGTTAGAASVYYAGSASYQTGFWGVSLATDWNAVGDWATNTSYVNSEQGQLYDASNLAYNSSAHTSQNNTTANQSHKTTHWTEDTNGQIFTLNGTNLTIKPGGSSYSNVLDLTKMRFTTWASGNPDPAVRTISGPLASFLTKATHGTITMASVASISASGGALSPQTTDGSNTSMTLTANIGAWRESSQTSGAGWDNYNGIIVSDNTDATDSVKPLRNNYIAVRDGYEWTSSNDWYSIVGSESVTLSGLLPTTNTTAANFTSYAGVNHGNAYYDTFIDKFSTYQALGENDVTKDRIFYGTIGGTSFDVYSNSTDVNATNRYGNNATSLSLDNGGYTLAKMDTTANNTHRLLLINADQASGENTQVINLITVTKDTGANVFGESRAKNIWVNGNYVLVRMQGVNNSIKVIDTSNSNEAALFYLPFQEFVYASGYDYYGVQGGTNGALDMHSSLRKCFAFWLHELKNLSTGGLQNYAKNQARAITNIYESSANSRYLYVLFHDTGSWSKDTGGSVLQYTSPSMHFSLPSNRYVAIDARIDTENFTATLATNRDALTITGGGANGSLIKTQAGDNLVLTKGNTVSSIVVSKTNTTVTMNAIANASGGGIDGDATSVTVQRSRYIHRNRPFVPDADHGNLATDTSTAFSTTTYGNTVTNQITFTSAQTIDYLIYSIGSSGTVSGYFPIQLDKHATSSSLVIGGTDIGDDTLSIGGANLYNASGPVIPLQYIFSYLRDVSKSFTDATCDTTKDSATVTMDSTAAVAVGMRVRGTGVAEGTIVTNKDANGTTLTLSSVNTHSANQTDTTLTFHEEDEALLEGPVSDESDAVTVSNVSYYTTVSSWATIPSDVTKVRIYRVGMDFASYYWLADVFVDQSYSDQTYTVGSTAVVPNYDKNPPPALLTNIVQVNGTFFGNVGAKLYFSEFGTPHSWPKVGVYDLDGDATNIIEYSGEATIFTANAIYRARGYQFDSMQVVKTPSRQGLPSSHYDSLVEYAGALYFISNDGLCAYSGGAAKVISFEKINPFPKITNPRAAFKDNALYVFAGSAGGEDGVKMDTRASPTAFSRISQRATLRAFYDQTDDKLYIKGTENGEYLKGSNISITYQSGEFSGDSTETVKIFHGARITYSAASQSTIKFYKNGGTSVVETVTLASAVNETCKYVQFSAYIDAKYINYKVEGDIVLFGIGIEYEMLDTYGVKQTYEFADVQYTGGTLRISFTLDNGSALTMTPDYSGTDLPDATTTKTIRLYYPVSTIGVIPHYTTTGVGEVHKVEYKTSDT